MSDILERLRLRQSRIVSGTVHTCSDTCTHPDCLAVASLLEIERLRAVNAAMRHDLGVLRGFHHEGCVAEIERLRGLI